MSMTILMIFEHYSKQPRQAKYSQPASEGCTGTAVRRIDQESTAFAETNEDEDGSPPTIPWLQQRCVGQRSMNSR